MKNIKINIIQTNLYWEDRAKNLKQLGQKIDRCKASDIIVLPEMFNTAFSMQPELFSEEEEGVTLQWMKQKALEKQSAIVGSLMCEEKGNYYNRLYFVRPDGIYEKYDKRHLFSMGNEDQYYSAGKERIIIEYKGWKILPLICYDLRFPVFGRNSFDGKNYAYDLMIYIANWPAARSEVWSALLKARAIENQVYVVGLNRVGEDGNKVAHSGDSEFINPRGQQMAAIPANEEATLLKELDFDALQKFRQKFHVGKDWDFFEIKK